jgi:hypothetical protein
MAKLKIKNWEKFQHYKHRNPPWIKLHKELLASQTWVMLADASRVLAIAMMLLASQKDNEFEDSDEERSYIKRVAYLDSLPDFKPLIKCGFLEYLQADASNLQADASKCEHLRTNADPETETETEIEKDNEITNVISCSQQVDEADVVVKLILKDGTLFPIKEDKVKFWEDAFSGVDVRSELKKMQSWLISNPRKRKTRGGSYRAINSWLARCHGAKKPVYDESFHGEVKKLFSEVLPDNPINVWTSKADQDLHNRINGDYKLLNMRELRSWRNFFFLVKTSSHIKKHEWHLDYLVREDVFANIVNGKRHTEQDKINYVKLKEDYRNQKEHSENV